MRGSSVLYESNKLYESPQRDQFLGMHTQTPRLRSDAIFKIEVTSPYVSTAKIVLPSFQTMVIVIKIINALTELLIFIV